MINRTLNITQKIKSFQNLYDIRFMIHTDTHMCMCCLKSNDDDVCESTQVELAERSVANAGFVFIVLGVYDEMILT